MCVVQPWWILLLRNNRMKLEKQKNKLLTTSLLFNGCKLFFSLLCMCSSVNVCVCAVFAWISSIYRSLFYSELFGDIAVVMRVYSVSRSFRPARWNSQFLYTEIKQVNSLLSNLYCAVREKKTNNIEWLKIHVKLLINQKGNRFSVGWVI